MRTTRIANAFCPSVRRRRYNKSFPQRRREVICPRPRRTCAEKNFGPTDECRRRRVLRRGVVGRSFHAHGVFNRRRGPAPESDAAEWCRTGRKSRTNARQMVLRRRVCRESSAEMPSRNKSAYETGRPVDHAADADVRDVSRGDVDHGNRLLIGFHEI